MSKHNASHHRRRAQPTEKAVELRIIGGRWRGRKIKFIPADGLRPTSDRIRETLFNWLMPTITGAHVLDLFAGSGALSIEALSRGAADATLIELSPVTTRHIKKTLTELNADNFTVIQSKGEDWLQQTFPEALFDLVFLDPPFASDTLVTLLQALEASNCLHKQSMIYIETGCTLSETALPENWQIHRQKKTGRVFYYLIIRQQNM